MGLLWIVRIFEWDIKLDRITCLQNDGSEVHSGSVHYDINRSMNAEKVPLLKELLESIVHKEFLIYLQPKFHVESLERFTVLKYWSEKDGSIASPFKFIPLLESEGLISYIDFLSCPES